MRRNVLPPDLSRDRIRQIGVRAAMDSKQARVGADKSIAEARKAMADADHALAQVWPPRLSFADRARQELPAAEEAVRQSKAHLDHLAARLALGKGSAQAARVLTILEQTYDLQLGHVELLRREITLGM